MRSREKEDPMGIWKKGIIGIASAAVISTGAIAAFATNGTQPSPQPSTSVDVKGPCDEAEHANDARCDGAQVPEDRNGVLDRNDDKGAQAEAGDDNGGVNQGNDDGANHDANDDNGGVNQGNDDGANHDANDDNGGVNQGNDDGANHDANDDNGGVNQGNDDGANHDANDDN